MGGVRISENWKVIKTNNGMGDGDKGVFWGIGRIDNSI